MAATGIPANPSLLAEIIENARVTTQVRWAHILHYDAERRVVMEGASATIVHPDLKRTAELASRIVPGFPLGRVAFPVDVNGHIQSIYLEGRTVCAPMLDVAAGTLDPRVLRLAHALGGMRYTYGAPLRLDGRVVGGIAFHSARPFSLRMQRICEAFVRQATLTIEREAMRQALEEHVRELADSRRLIIDASERLRRDIADALHGRVQTRLLVAWHQLGQVLSRLDPHSWEHQEIAAVRESLDRLRDDEVRRISHALHPAVIRVGLLPAVRSLADSVAGQIAVDVRASPGVAAADTPAGSGLPEPVRLAVYRVLEEALANVCRHAHATRAEIELETDGEWLRAQVRDDGVGFDPRKERGGLGLTNIGLLAEAHGGQWTVHSVPGRGTCVEVRLPIAVT